MKNIGINIDCDCPICHKDEENIVHLFKDCDLAYNVWTTININCPNPLQLIMVS